MPEELQDQEQVESRADDDLSVGREESTSESQATEEPSGGVESDLRQVAASLGVDPSYADGFSSVADLQRAVALWDRQLVGRQQPQQVPPPQYQQPQSQLPPNPQGSPQPPAKLDLAKFKDFEPEVQEVVKAFIEQQQQFEQYRQQQDAAMQQMFAMQQHGWIQQQQQAIRQEENAIHDALDSIGGDRFGKSLDDSGRTVYVSDEQAANRARVIQAYVSLKQIHAQEGRSVSPAALARRAATLVFSEDDQKAQAQARIKEQSKQRLGKPGRQRAAEVGSKDYDPAKDTELLSIYRQMEKENGSR